MNMKKLLATGLVGAMAVAMLAGCGNGSSEEQAPASSTTAEDTSTSSPEDTDASAQTDAEVFEGFDELQNIDVWGMSFFGDGGTKEVVQAINDIAGEAINVNITWHPCDIATYMSQLPLMMTDQVGPDLILVTAIPNCSFATFTSQNQLTDITDLLPVFAPKATALMSDYLAGTSNNGRIYAMPCYRMYNSSYWLVMNKDVTDALGLTEQAEAISSFSEYEALLEEVKNRQDELDDSLKTPWMTGANDAEGGVISAMGCYYPGDDFASAFGYDSLQNQSKLIYVNTETDTVENYFKTDSYRNTCEMAYEMMQKGLVHPDSQTLTDGGDVLMANHTMFSMHVKCEESVVADKTAAVGNNVIAIRTVEIPVQSGDASGWAWGVPANSQKAEAAVAFMELMYTNADIENLFVYGIEGRDYEVVDGEAHLLPTKEYQCSDFFFGNQFLAYPGQGSGADFRETSLAALENAQISKYFGLVINTDKIANELTAIQNVITQYGPGLVSGTVSVDDPKGGLEAFWAALDAAGVEDVLAEYQAQLDAWMAQQ